MDHRLNNMGTFVDEQIDKVLREIPKEAQYIDLSLNQLHQLPIATIERIIKALPKNVNALNLGRNELHTFSADQLISLLKALGPNISSLDLSFTKFNGYSEDELKRIFAAIPESVTELTLQYCNLGEIKNNVLHTAFTALHKKLVSIDLQGNNLHSLVKMDSGKDEPSTEAIKDLDDILNALPDSLRRLGLSHNGLGNLILSKLVFLIKTLNPKLRELDLSSNHLHTLKDKKELNAVAQSLPEGIAYVNLYELYSFDECGDLTEFFDAFPAHVRAIKYRHSIESPQSYKINEEINSLSSRSTANKLATATGLVLSGKDKKDALINLEKILNSHAQNHAVTDDADLVELLQKWLTEHQEIIGTKRNRVSSLFSTHVSSTEKLVEQVFAKLGIDGYKPSLTAK